MIDCKTINRGVFTLVLLMLLASTAALAGGKPPVVTNSPGTEAEIGSTYVYKVQAWDPEGDTLEFEIRNRPSWLWWKQDEGRLVGEPSSADAGSHEQIKILVSDGTNTTEVGPFTVNVGWGSKTTDTNETTSTTWRKRHAGHYVSMNRYDDHTDMIEAIKPGVKGFQIRYTWRSLEPWQGGYDFSEIRKDLKLAASQGMQLVVFIEDKSFNGKYPTPGYLKHLTVENRNRGYTALRWEPWVVTRFNALLAALGKEFDSHPAFEGVAIQESSPSLTDHVLNQNGYSPSKYRNALIEMIRAARKSFPQSQVFWYMNFLPRNQDYIADIANVAANLDVAMGGPDVLPDSKPLKELSYPFYDAFRGRMTLFNSMQYHSYAHERKSQWGAKYWTMNQLFVYARDELHVDYLFWNRKAMKRPGDSYSWWDALPVIDKNAWF